MNKENFLQRSRDIHGYKYDYVNLPDKIKLSDYIELNYGGNLYRQRVSKHLMGNCPEKNTPNKSKEQFIEESTKVWGNRFDYSESIYINSNSKIRFFDKINNRYAEQIASLHIRGYEPKKIDGDHFIKESKLVSDYKYQYEKCDYQNKTKKVLLVCPLHGDFFIKPFDHLNYGIECDRCEDGVGKKNIRKFLEGYNISHYREYKFINCGNECSLPFDFYIPTMRTCIEFNGIHHFQPFEYFGGSKTLDILKQNDKIKSDYCEDNFLNLIRIKYDQINIVDEILWENLKSFIKK